MGQKLLTWIRLIKICYIVLWWPSWLSDQIAFIFLIWVLGPFQEGFTHIELIVLQWLQALGAQEMQWAQAPEKRP